MMIIKANTASLIKRYGNVPKLMLLYISHGPSKANQLMPIKPPDPELECELLEKLPDQLPRNKFWGL